MRRLFIILNILREEITQILQVHCSRSLLNKTNATRWLLLIKILFLLLPICATAQDTIVTFTPSMANKKGYIALGHMNGWIFKKGNNASWASNNIDYSDWQKLMPANFTEKLADSDGKLEGWLRLKFTLDTSFGDTLLEMLPYTWAATDVYVDGRLMYNFGNSGANGKPFQEYNPTDKFPVRFALETGKVHLLAIHFVDFRSSLPPFRLKSADQFTFNYFVLITLPRFEDYYLKEYTSNQISRTVWLIINITLCLLFWVLAFQNRDEKNLRAIALTSTFFTLTIYCDQSGVPVISYAYFAFLRLVWAMLLPVSFIFSLLLMIRIFKRKINTALKISLWAIGLCGIAQAFFPLVLIFIISLALFLSIYYISVSWKSLKGAQWAVQVGILLLMSFGLALVTTALVAPDANYSVFLWIFTGVSLSFPLSLLVYVAMRFKEIIGEVSDHAKQVVRLSEEKREQALNQQKILQEEVNRQTIELRTSLENLQSTQAQLIQSEKMASLGELTAGIAHEIQNPLNFVNNFSEVNRELITEMNNEMERGNFDEAKAISKDIQENEEKIISHGKRADGIVKGMLMHSRTSTGQKELTDINALADEYLRLSYHGLRAKDKSFNAKFETHFDNTIGKINIVPQDLGRVLLNLVNNAFYAVSEKKQQLDAAYQPTVSVSTKKLKDGVEIKVKDNGNGIPQKVMNKIFQPFFTTKPTGAGTGLGLSLSYDIIKAHGGEIKVQTHDNEGAEFIIHLPA